MTAPPVTMSLGRHSADVMGDTPRQCPRCQREARWWRNQAGATVCRNCAEQAEEGSHERAGS